MTGISKSILPSNVDPESADLITLQGRPTTIPLESFSSLYVEEGTRTGWDGNQYHLVQVTRADGVSMVTFLVAPDNKMALEAKWSAWQAQQGLLP